MNYTDTLTPALSGSEALGMIIPCWRAWICSWCRFFFFTTARYPKVTFNLILNFKYSVYFALNSQRSDVWLKGILIKCSYSFISYVFNMPSIISSTASSVSWSPKSKSATLVHFILIKSIFLIFRDKSSKQEAAEAGGCSTTIKALPIRSLCCCGRPSERY